MNDELRRQLYAWKSIIDQANTDILRVAAGDVSSEVVTLQQIADSLENVVLRARRIISR